MAVYLGSNAVNMLGGSSSGGGGGTPSLQSKTYTVSGAGTATVTADSGYDGLSSVAVSVPSAAPFVGNRNERFYDDNGTRRWGIDTFIEVDASEGDIAGWLPDGYSQVLPLSRPAVPSNTTITPTTSAQTVGGAKYMMEGAVTVAAMPSGTAGTPTATKGTVSNHQVSITPSVTNTSGYITGSTKTGTAVTVSASELVSGFETKTENGTYDVTNLASLVVNVASGGANIDTKTVTPSDAMETSIQFTDLLGTPKAFFVRCTATLSRSSSYRHYYVATMCFNGTNTTGNRWYRYNGQFSNITSGYSYTYSDGTLTLHSSGNQTTSPGSFINGTYELVYIY